MQTRRYTRVPGMILAVMLTLLVGQGLVFGHGDGDRTEPSELEGTWNVTLRFPDCTCGLCPGGVANSPIPNVNTYLKHGALLVAPGSPFAGPGQGQWERLSRHHFVARFTFLAFNPDGSRRGSEVVTKDIRLLGPDEFKATSTFDFFDTDGNITVQGCPINETATRFE
jgi:hypothetical protein